MKRYGQVIKVDLSKIQSYIEYHANPWKEVNEMIKKCNIENYSIFLKDDYLFAYFEYVGDDFDVDMAKMAEDPRTREWWNVVKPAQIPLDTRKEGEWWADMQEVYHLD